MVRVSTGLKGFEKPVLWQPIAQAFAQENQMLTPKMSLRRVNIVTAYGGLLKALYEGKGHAVRYKRDTSDCNACHLRDSKVRCNRNTLNISADPTYAPGAMGSMFSSIESRFAETYDVTVVSRDPWVVTFDNFLSDDEVSALITTVADNWERSTDTGTANEFGETGRTVSKGRTSSNAWCRQPCLSNAHVQSAIRKIEEVTSIPSTHFESFQILQYEVGQFYKTHHDMGM
ncbi:hypothetical protein B484DRAFT_484205 [Ochromonadaceae sp. CCMP2298]|nr:hypothetical protein B484DRAFT_484205 [Ochromonadaceae sp. CCMP2298]